MVLKRTITMVGLVTIAFILIILITREKENIRKSNFAGRFYPANPDILSKEVKAMLSRAQKIEYGDVKAVLVPHAGYMYSGQVAAASFVQLKPNFRKVFILTANHARVLLEGVSLDTHTHFEIPGAKIPVSGLVHKLLKKALYTEIPLANSMHMIEVELPFLKAIKDKFEIIPMVIGSLNEKNIEEIVKDLVKHSDNAIYVFSVDLSHYHPWEDAVRMDRACLVALKKLDKEALLKDCRTDGNHVLYILLRLAEELKLKPHLVMYRNSGDVTGDKIRVVGYGAMVFSKGFYLSEDDKKVLKEIAEKTVELYVNNGRVYKPKVKSTTLKVKRASFVTLKKKGELRGCIGSLWPIKPLYIDVRDNAISAATRDPRFPPVAPYELKEIEIIVSVLDPPEPLILTYPAEATLMLSSKDGVILWWAGRRSTFLPEVWHDIPNPKDFLERLCLKQGSPPDCWKYPGSRILTYKAEEF